MRQFNKFRGTKGFITMWERVIRFRYMITEEAKERCRILAFWEKHGTDATTEAFKVSKRTLFRWQENLGKTLGKLEGLNRGSTAPKKRNKRIVPIPLSDRIIQLRTLHPRMGKEKIHAILKKEGYTGCVSTVGRIIFNLKEKGLLPSPRKIALSGRRQAHRVRNQALQEEITPSKGVQSSGSRYGRQIRRRHEAIHCYRDRYREAHSLCYNIHQSWECLCFRLPHQVPGGLTRLPYGRSN